MRALALLLGVLTMTAPLLAGGLPAPTVPDGLGVNIHFTGAPERDLELLTEAGFRFVRMDFAWQSVEREPGRYDFAPYDQLTAALARRGVRALYILDYSHPRYEAAQSVRTAEGRQAFARFAAAAAARYRGQGVIWELWNEPNIGFWQPQPSVDDYMALAHAVFPALRQADPGAVCVAPASAGVPLDFLEACFQRGLLELVDAVSVHPYRRQPPETAAEDLARLRALIARYRPDRPDLPVISGEWGYSCAWDGFDADRQGRYLPRQFLSNLALGLPLSIWYDWHDDGPDPKEPEHHFGTVTLDYAPKPAYLGMQRLAAALRGLRCLKRLESAPEDYLLAFSDGRRLVVAAWTAGEPHPVPVLPGEPTPLTGEVQYLPVPARAYALRAQAAWTVRPRSVGVWGGAAAGAPLAPELRIEVRNPFRRALPVQFRLAPPPGLRGRFLGPRRLLLAPGQARSLCWRGEALLRQDQPLTLTVEADLAGMRSRQTVSLRCLNYLQVQAALQREGRLAAVIENPAGDQFQGVLEVQVGDQAWAYSLALGARAQVRPLGGAPGPARVETVGSRVLVTLPLAVPSPLHPVRLAVHQGKPVRPPSAGLVVAGGDLEIPAEFSVADVPAEQAAGCASAMTTSRAGSSCAWPPASLCRSAAPLACSACG